MQIQLNPILCAAGGAAFSYYGLYTLLNRLGMAMVWPFFALVLLSITVVCLSRVLASWPLVADVQKERLLRLVSLRIAAFTVGLALGMGAGAQAVRIVNFGIPETAVQGISGILLDDPRRIAGDRAMTTFSLNMALGEGGVRTSARGEITVFFPEESAGRLREFGRGSEVFAEGTLRRGSGGFDGSYLFSADTLHITKIASPLERFRTGLRLDLTRRFSQSGDAAWGGLALALLVGIRDNLDTGVAALYRNAGCAHILALSGMHLAVLVALISFLLKRPLGLKLAAIAGALLIIAYCFLVGPFPSLNRAALMYLLGVLAVVGMLKRDAFSLLCMAFLLQLTFTPQSGFSLSFMLSYFALAGIIILGGSLNRIFKGLVPVFLLSPLAVSLGAFIATAPMAAYYFDILRPVGILAGLVLTPLITVFMVGSMIWLGFDFVLPSLSFLLGAPLALLYRLMEKTAAIAGHIPGIRGGTALVITLSILAAALTIWFDRRRRLRSQRMEPFA